MLAILGGDRLDDATTARLVGDPLVSSLLVLHDIHPAPMAAREYDPGPSQSEAPAAASGLVQIDLGRSRAPKSDGEP
jgi:hypothetical protein